MSEKRGSLTKLWKDLGTQRWIVLLAAGLLLAVIVWPPGEKDGPAQTAPETGAAGEASAENYEKQLEKRLVKLLSQIEGAGQVEVMVTLKESSEQIVKSDTTRQESLVRETDASGGVRDNSDVSESSQTVLTGSGGALEPLIIGETRPKGEGVVVACEGGDRASVRSEISAAIQALFDIDLHKIKVCKMAS